MVVEVYGELPWRKNPPWDLGFLTYLVEKVKEEEGMSFRWKRERRS